MDSHNKRIRIYIIILYVTLEGVCDWKRGFWKKHISGCFGKGIIR